MPFAMALRRQSSRAKNATHFRKLIYFLSLSFHQRKLYSLRLIYSCTQNLKYNIGSTRGWVCWRLYTTNTEPQGQHRGDD